MSVREKLTAFTDRYVETSNIRTHFAIFIGQVALGRIRKIDDVRNIGPEPFDFFMHNGNILSSYSTAIAVAALVAINAHMSEKPTPHFKTKIMAASLCTGAAVNWLVETRTGLSMPFCPSMFRNSSPDKIDFYYGMVGAAGGGLTAIAISKDPNAEQMEVIILDPPDKES